MRLGFRHCDHRTPFLWQSDTQPAARWHGEGEGPVNYFADTPVGAWAEFLRHEEITEPADLAGVRRSLWVVELPDGDYATPKLSTRVMTGGLASYTACQAEARRLDGHLAITSAARWPRVGVVRPLRVRRLAGGGGRLTARRGAAVGAVLLSWVSALRRQSTKKSGMKFFVPDTTA
jgi:hypothetical protein